MKNIFKTKSFYRTALFPAVIFVFLIAFLPAPAHANFDLSVLTPDTINAYMLQNNSNTVVNGSQDYLFSNTGTDPLDYTVSADNWIDIQICAAPSGVPPLVITDNPTGVTATTADLNGQVNPNGSAAQAWFEISGRAGQFGTQTLSAGSIYQALTPFSLSGLSCGTTYPNYYRAAAENSSGIAYGNWISITTPSCGGSGGNPSPPVVETKPVTFTVSNEVTLNGEVMSPSCGTGDCYHTYFLAGLSPSSLAQCLFNDCFRFDLSIVGTQGAASFGKSISLSALAPNTYYYYQACADDVRSVQTGCGSILNFLTDCPAGTIPDGIGTGLCTTPPPPPDCTTDGSPIVETLDAGTITSDSAVLNGNLIAPTGSSAAVYFKWGKKSSSLSSTLLVANSTKTAPENFSETLSSLLPGDYYFSAYADNANGTSCEDIKSFTIPETACDILGNCPDGLVQVMNGGSAIISGKAAPVFKTIAVTGLASGMLRLWSLALLFFGAKRKQKTWGVVYDSVTKAPLDPVFLELIDGEGRQIATSITDSKGRYGFLVPPGTYMIRPRRAHFVFPSMLLGRVTRDELYDHLYFGNYFELKKNEQLVTKNIPMDPENAKLSDIEKHEERLANLFSKNAPWLSDAAEILFGIGLVIALAIFILSPNAFNTIVLGIYIALLIIRELGISRSELGTVINKHTGRPLAYAVVRVYSYALGNEVVHKITTKYGRFYCLVPNGSYFVAIEKKNKDGSYIRLFTSPKVTVTKEKINGIWKV